MRQNFCRLLLLACLASCNVQAQTNSDVEPGRRLVEQKLKLIEMLVNSPTAQASTVGREAEAPALIGASHQLLDQARAEIAAQRYDSATQILDEALRNISKANTRLASEAGMAASAQTMQFHDLASQIETYRASLQDLSKDERKGELAKKLLASVDKLAGEGQKLFSAGRLGDANKKMADAYKLAVEEISRLRAGQEVIMSLKFDSPREEFAYEQKRFQSNEILVGMMIDEGRAEGDRRKLVDGFLAEALRLKNEAGQQARSNDHKTAVSTMEQAVAQMNRALQSMGIPVF